MSEADLEQLRDEVRAYRDQLERLKEDVQILTLFAGVDVVGEVRQYVQETAGAKPDVKAKCMKFLERNGHLAKLDDEWVRKQEYLETLQDDYGWPYLDMICLINRNDGKTAVLKNENGTYILIPDVHPRHPFEVPRNARRGRKEFLEVLVNEGWKPD